MEDFGNFKLKSRLEINDNVISNFEIENSWLYIIFYFWLFNFFQIQIYILILKFQILKYTMRSITSPSKVEKNMTANYLYDAFSEKIDFM